MDGSLNENTSIEPQRNMLPPQNKSLMLLKFEQYNLYYWGWVDEKRWNKLARNKPKKYPNKRWDKRQRVCSLVDEGEEEEEEEEDEDEMKSAHTAFRLQQLRAKVSFSVEISAWNTEIHFWR